MLHKLLLGVIASFILGGCNLHSANLNYNKLSTGLGSQVIFDNGPTRQGYNNNISPHKHAFDLNTEQVRYGNYSERYEVRDGDCGGSDCTSPRYRSEIMSKKNIASPNQEAWYGWSFYNKNIPSFRRDKNPMIVVGQWKYGQTDSISPPIKFHHQDDGYVWIQLDDMRRTKGTYWRTCKLWHMERNQGKWVDIVMQTNWGTDDNGYLNIWINGIQKCNYKGQILANWRSHYPNSGHSWGKHLTHRRGVYVSYTKRFRQNYPDEKLPTFIAYYDEFRQGKTRQEVDIRYIINNKMKAID